MSNFSLPMQWNANPDQVMGDFEPIPAAWYNGFISEMEYKEKSGKQGEGFLQFTVEIDEGEHKGRTFYDNLMLWDQGEKVQQFVQRKLNSLCVATGQHQISDLNQLMNKRLSFRLKLQEARDVVDENTGEKKTYQARNQISGYKAMSAAPQASPPAVGTPAPGTQSPPPAQQQAAPAQQPPAQTAPPPAQAAAPAQQPAPAQTAQPAPGGGGAAGSVPPWLQNK